MTLIPGTPAAISVCGLTKRFSISRWFGSSRGVHAVDSISFEVARGEIVALMGSNGAGKTTLLNLLATLVTPDCGSARVAGADVVRDAAEVRQRIGVMPQAERSFFGQLTAEQNLTFFAALAGLQRAGLRRRIEEVLDLVGLDPCSGRAFVKFSSGMQRRLGLARALLHDPAVLLLDEPTHSIDPLGAEESLVLLRNLAKHQGKTVLMVSHDFSEVAAICDRMLLIVNGRIAAETACKTPASPLQIDAIRSIYRAAVRACQEAASADQNSRVPLS